MGEGRRDPLQQFGRRVRALPSVWPDIPDRTVTTSTWAANAPRSTFSRIGCGSKTRFHEQCQRALS